MLSSLSRDSALRTTGTVVECKQTHKLLACTTLAVSRRGSTVCEMEQLAAVDVPEGEPIRLLQITDLHHLGLEEGHTEFAGPRVTVPIGEYEDGDELKPEVTPGNYSLGRGIAVVTRLLDQVAPHLVVFTGDIIDGRMCSDHRRAMAEVVRPCQERGVPWTFTPGNHDDDPPSSWSREDLLDILRLPGCAAPAATSFNHTFKIGEVVRLFFFDSHGNPHKTTTDGVQKEAIQAYETLSASPELVAERQAGVIGLAYFHIPLPEYADTSSKILKGRIDDLTALRPPGFEGRMVGSPRTNTGLYEAMARQGNVLSVFVGHDHYHDAVMKRPDEGPYLCYGRVTAFSPPADFEGAGGPLPFQRGGRVVEINPQVDRLDAVCTWVETVSGEEPSSRVELVQQSRVSLEARL